MLDNLLTFYITDLYNNINIRKVKCMNEKSLVCKVVVIIVVLIALGSIGFYFFCKSSYEILVESSNICDGKEYFFIYCDKDVYIDCINDISIRKSGKVYKLNDAIERGIISFDEILEEADKKIEYWDGGSILYQYKDFTIIDYQRLLDKNCNFIVIGNEDISLEDYCK